MGATLLKTMQQRGHVQKNLTVNSARGTIYQGSFGKFMVTYDPGMRHIEADAQQQILWDIRLAQRFVRHGHLNPVLGKYRWTEDFSELIEKIEDQFDKTGVPVDVAVDTETMDLWPWYAKDGKEIVTIQASAEEGSADVVYTRGMQSTAKRHFLMQVKWLLTTPKVKIKGANWKYDALWIWVQWGIDCTNFTMDTTAVGSLLNENRCVAPETRLLTADLRWVRADSLEEGDKLVGFDEEPRKKADHRRMWKASVVSTEIIQKPRIKLTLSNGGMIVVSDNHQFICRKYPSTQVKVWRKARNIKPGCVICHATPNPDKINGVATDFDRGRLSGFLDGEGSAHKVNSHGSWNLSWAQKPHAAHEDIKRIASEIGFEFREHDDNISVCKQVVARGAYGGLHALIATRPVRLISKESWVNGPLPRPADNVVVVSVEPLGVGPVVALETDTHTYIAEGLLSHNSNSLKWHIKEECPDLGGYDEEMNEKYDMGKMELIPKGPLLNYTGPDADGTLRVSNIFRKKLSEERLLQRFYVKLLHPALKAYEKVERRGVYVDQKKMAALRAETVTFIAERDKAMLSMLSGRLRAKYADKIQENIDAGKAPISATMLRDHFFDGTIGMGLKPKLFTEKSGAPSTANEHFVMFSDHPEAAPFVKLAKEVNEARKTQGTFIDGFMKHLRPDGRLHPTYMLFHGEMYDDGSNDGGTNTGRLSCKNPAMQTLSKHSDWGKKIRRCFTGPDGKICWEFDFSQGELRIAACDAGETKMIDAYKHGIDVHAITGSTFASMDTAEFIAFKKAEKGSEQKALFEKYRQRGKHANFGMIFEISAEGFQVYCRRKELHITVKEAEEYLAKFFDTWPRLRPWQAESKAFARQNGFAVSPLGRIRHLPLINSRDGFTRSREERRSINAKIQSTLSDLCIWSVARVEEALGDQASVIGTTHDSMYGYMEESDAHWLLPQIRQIMMELPYREEFGWHPPLDFPVDCKIGHNTADMVEIEKWDLIKEYLAGLNKTAA